MLILLSEWISQYIPSFRVVEYLTFRAVMSLFTALALSLWLGPAVIRFAADAALWSGYKKRRS